MSKFLLRISSLVTVLSYCLAFLPCLSFATESGVISSPSKYIRGVKGRYRYYHDENSVCESVVMLNVGTAMSNGDYRDLALDTIRASPDTVFIVVDNNPRVINKQSPRAFAGIANAIADDLTNLIPQCKEATPKKGFLIGGHSAGGQATIDVMIQEGLLHFNVVGYVGLAPFNVNKKKMTIGVPSLIWDFSRTSCGVTFTQAGLAAYQISSPEIGRLFYRVQTSNWNPILGPHCSFTNSGCASMCAGERELNSWIGIRVGKSIAIFIEEIKSGNEFSERSFGIDQPGVELYVNHQNVTV